MRVSAETSRVSDASGLEALLISFFSWGNKENRVLILAIPQRISAVAQKQRPLVFVYHSKYATNGSTIMRGRQLSQIVRDNGVRDAVAFQEVSARLKNSDVFMTKGAVRHTPPRVVEKMKKRGCRILIDPVDEAIPPHAAPLADVIIAASHTAFEEFSQSFPDTPVVQVDHHVDPRVRAAVGAPAPSEFRAAYFGELFNTIQSPAIEAMVDFYSVSTANQEATEWFSRLGDYSFHYAVRARQERDAHKPFLKGFTAAVCGAPVLVQTSEAEPLHWMGADYPFLISGESDEASILAALCDAQDAFGGPRWSAALDAMASIADRTSDARIACAVRTALD